MAPKHIAVLGGGITGLTSAFHLSRRFPRSQITLLEKTSHHGGWINSRRVDVRDHEGHSANVCLESGPRTLRPNNVALLELINLLGLKSSVITTHVAAPASKYRFLHIPGTNGLTALPSSLWSLFTTPIASLLLHAMIREPWKKANRPPGISDESFDGLLTRRFGAEFARTLGSAVVHGIYACDSRLLSVRAAFPTVWEMEERGDGSVGRGFLRRRKDSMAKKRDYELGDVPALMAGVSVYSFVDGVETLSRSLRKALDNASNVTIQNGVTATGLHPSDRSDAIQIETNSGRTTEASHVVSALPLPALQPMLSPTASLPCLSTNPMSTVTVINIIFPPTPLPIHPPGFGYLIPRPASGYATDNPGILGTVFDSSSLSAQDRASHSKSGQFTKLTVMMGGPHPLTHGYTSPGTVLKHLQQHLNPPFTLPEPVFFESRVQRDCIPTLTVGHVQRMEEMRDILKHGPWKGRLEVVGSGVGGVSVGDCVEAGRNVGKDW